MRKIHIFFTAMRVPLDALTVFGSLLAAYSIRQVTDLIPGVQIVATYVPELQEYLLFSASASLLFVLLGFISDLYTMRARSLRRDVWKAVITAAFWMLALIAYFFLIREFFYSRLVLLYAFVLLCTGLALTRLVLRGFRHALMKRGVGVERIAVVGYNAATKELLKHLEKEPTVCVEVLLSRKTVSGLSVPVQAGKGPFEELLAHYRVDTVIQTEHTYGDTESSQLLTYCRQNHIRYSLLPDALELQLSNVGIRWVQDLPLMEFKPTRLDGWGRVFKRLFDILGALLAFVLLSPFILGTALAVMIQMRSPKEILFSQKRYGYRGKLFRFFKFQSMRKGAEAEHEKLMAEGAGERKGLLKIKEDPRVTKVGRVIRKTSLDELPQLWNVLNGTMSMVGPRPHIPQEIDKVTRDYQRVLSVKPGITGLAQVSGRSSIDFDEEMRLDLAYIENWSLWGDVVILWKTVWKVMGVKNSS